MNMKTIIMTIASSALIGTGLLFFFVARSFLKEWVIIQGNPSGKNLYGKAAVGEKIVFTGVVSEFQNPAKEDFVIAKDLQYYGGEDSGWSWQKDYTQEFKMTCDGLEIHVTPLHCRIEGKAGEVIDPADENKKTVGIRKGDLVTCSGIVTGVSPLKVEVSTFYCGEVKAYSTFMKGNTIRFSIIPLLAFLFAVIFFIGALLAVVKR